MVAEQLQYLVPGQQMADTLDALGVGMCLFDSDGCSLLWNASFLRLFPEHAGHVYRGETYQENLRRFYQGRLDASELVHLDRYIEDGVRRHQEQVAPFEFRHLGQWIRVASAPMEGVGRVRLWTPISAPQLDAETLAFRMASDGKSPSLSLIDEIADGLMVRDPNGLIRFVNRSFHHIYALHGENDAVGNDFRRFFEARWAGHARQNKALSSFGDHELYAGVPYVIELPGDRWVRVIEHRAPDGSGISTHADVTDLHRLQRDAVEAQAKAEAMAASLQALIDERDRAEAALRQAQRVEAVGLLTSGVAHDFNNLLTVMLANLERLEPEVVNDDRHNRLAVIRGAVERGAALTGQLLSFARRQPLAPKPVDLAAMAKGMAPLLRSAVGSAVSVQVEVPAGLPCALVDPAQLELVVLNLAVNARDALPKGGHIWIDGRIEILDRCTDPEAPEPGNYVVLSVRDDGIGMAEAVRQRAVEPFFTTKPLGAGSGLGLSQAYGLARQSGGTVRIASALGCGTQVDIVLPLVVGADAPTLPDAAPAISVKRLRVLLVDDDPVVLSTIAEILSLQGAEVTPALGGPAALHILADDMSFDVIVSDVRMQQLSGPDLARFVWARDAHMPVVLISGYAAPEDIAGLQGPCRLLRKPFPSRALMASMEDMVCSRV